MGDVGFFLLLAVAAMLSFGATETLAIRRRRLRRELVDSRTPQSDEVFTVGISTLTPVPQGFVRAFRLAVARAIGVDHTRLLPTDRISKDLRAVNFDAWELAAVLERTFDMRVRVVDVMRAGTLRELCKQLYLGSENISESDPPLHRDPVPKLRAPEPEVIMPIEVTVPDQPADEGKH
ncbi:MAG: hypothetical protein K8I27_11835 [Planctomycetes bacterium]|nr:hypothetical protein [Planctomycetota bacterium]